MFAAVTADNRNPHSSSFAEALLRYSPKTEKEGIAGDIATFPFNVF